MVLLGRLLRYPTSFRGFMQFMQLQFEDRMTHYDFGTTGNMKHYGSVSKHYNGNMKRITFQLLLLLL